MFWHPLVLVGVCNAVEVYGYYLYNDCFDGLIMTSNKPSNNLPISNT